MGAQTASPAQAPEQRPPAEVIKELDALKQRVEQLEGELKSKPAPEQTTPGAAVKPAADSTAERTVSPADKVGSADAKPEPIADLRPLSTVPLTPRRPKHQRLRRRQPKYHLRSTYKPRLPTPTTPG